MISFPLLLVMMHTNSDCILLNRVVGAMPSTTHSPAVIFLILKGPAYPHLPSPLLFLQKIKVGAYTSSPLTIRLPVLLMLAALNSRAARQPVATAVTQ